MNGVHISVIHLYAILSDNPYVADTNCLAVRLIILVPKTSYLISSLNQIRYLLIMAKKPRWYMVAILAGFSMNCLYLSGWLNFCIPQPSLHYDSHCIIGLYRNVCVIIVVQRPYELKYHTVMAHIMYAPIWERAHIFQASAKHFMLVHAPISDDKSTSHTSSCQELKLDTV